MNDEQYFVSELQKKELNNVAIKQYLIDFLSATGAKLKGSESVEDLAGLYAQAINLIEADYIKQQVEINGDGYLGLVGKPMYQEKFEKHLDDYHKKIGVREPAQSQNFLGVGRMVLKVGAKIVQNANEKRAIEGKPPVGSQILSKFGEKINTAIANRQEQRAMDNSLPKAVDPAVQRPLQQIVQSIKSGNTARARAQVDSGVIAQSSDPNKDVFEKGKDVLDKIIGGYKESETNKAYVDKFPIMLVAVFVFGLLIAIALKK